MPRMRSPMSRQDEPGLDADPQVAATVRLLHRRRGWAWTSVSSFLIFVGGLIAGVNIFGDSSDSSLANATAVALLLLLALALAGLAVVVVDTLRLHRRPAAVREQARALTSHHRLRAHASRYPPRHLASWAAGWLVLATLVAAAVLTLPSQVNAVAYVAGAGRSVTFVPGSYHQVCDRGGCHNQTDGILDTGGGIPATWPGQVPLSRPFPVREPVWDGWYGSADLVSSTGGAVVWIVVGLFFDVSALFALLAAGILVRHRLRRRKSRSVI